MLGISFLFPFKCLMLFPALRASLASILISDFSTFLLSWWLPLFYSECLSKTYPVCLTLLPGNSKFCSHALYMMPWLLASSHGLIIFSGEDSLHSPKHWREKGTAGRNNDVAQLDTVCSCLEAAGLLLTPDPGPPAYKTSISDQD